MEQGWAQVLLERVARRIDRCNINGIEYQFTTHDGGSRWKAIKFDSFALELPQIVGVRTA